MDNNFTPPNPWQHARDFVNKAGTMAVRVTFCTLPPKFDGAIPLTHYTWELVRLFEGRVIRHFQVICQVNDGIVTTEDFPWDEFVEMLKAATEWVKDQRQVREDALTARRQAKERNMLGTPRGLKTLSREDAKKREVGAK
jgi:hypothetical protein